MEETLRVSGTSRPNAVAGAVAALIRSVGVLEIQAIGPAAVNQTVKALAIARGYLLSDGLDLNAQPAFVKLDMNAEERTAVRFLVRREDRPADHLKAADSDLLPAPLSPLP
ncbi:stage V sporulation protein S [Deinococcus irradiatisoli]|uniref:Stage V sporulation protein S n=1 Tax=Deinococcus irradiatisoli TaxID=2202254 RepID=A0A2Z3JII5_9DEIO|nr:stage V sporulation protein S [Deinococcus irradiatisoli]AWN23190.1 stage V sporulation protein S [Deinococcus irradiatisoli]